MRFLALALGIICAFATDDSDAAGATAGWVEHAGNVHTRFTGANGTFAQFGDSISFTMAFWAPLASEPKNMTPETSRALRVVKRRIRPECWSKWKGPAY